MFSVFFYIFLYIFQKCTKKLRDFSGFFRENPKFWSEICRYLGNFEDFSDILQKSEEYIRSTGILGVSGKFGKKKEASTGWGCSGGLELPEIAFLHAR